MNHTVDVAEQRRLMRQFEKRVLDEQAHMLITLWWYRIVLHRASVRGWQISPSHYQNQVSPMCGWRNKAGRSGSVANASVPTPAPKVQSISRRFSYAFIGVVTLILLGFAAIAIFVNIARIEARLENTVENALQLSNISLPAPLWKLDNDIVNDFIEALFLDQSLVYAEVSWGGQVVAKRICPKFQQKDLAILNGRRNFL